MATVTVGGTSTQATLTGLANAATDSFTATAVNGVGSSAGNSYTAAPATTVTGTVTAPSGAAAGSGFTVKIYLNDPPSASATDWSVPAGR